MEKSKEYAFIMSSIQGTDMVFLQLPEVPYLEGLELVGFLHDTVLLMQLQRKSDELFLQDPRWSPAHISPCRHLQGGVGGCITNTPFPLLEIFSLRSLHKNWKQVKLKWAIPINREHKETAEWLCRTKECGSQLAAMCCTKFRSYIVHTGGWYVLQSATLDLFAVLLIGAQVWAVVNSFTSQCILSNLLPGELIATVKKKIKLFLFSVFIYSVFLFHCLLLLEKTHEHSNMHLNCYCCSVVRAVSISWSESLTLPYDLSYSYFSYN